MTETIGNSELDSEYLAAQIIRGVLFPPEYIQTRSYFCDIKIVDFVADIYMLQMSIQKEIVSPFGTLQDKKVEKFSSGDHPALLELVKMLQAKCEDLLPVYEEGAREAFREALKEMHENIQGQDFLGMGQAFQVAASHKAELDHLRITKNTLEIISNQCEYLIQNYGVSDAKLKKKGIKPGNNTEYKLFIQDLINQPESFSGNIVLAMTMGRTLDAIKKALPMSDPVLNPFKLDETECLLESLCYPKDFYNMCESDKIVSRGIGETFGKCYPEYWKKFFNMYLEKYEDMDYQKQIQFRKCFGVGKNDTALVQFIYSTLSLPA